MRDLEESSLARFAIPDVLTPAQYYGGRRTSHPEMNATKRLLLAVLEDAPRCLQTYAENPNRASRQALARARLGSWTGGLKGPSRLYLYARLWGSSPTICTRAYVSGVCNCLRAEIRAAYNGAPCAEMSLWARWSAGGRTIPDRHAAKQPSHALRANRSIERWA
jgi:hypothetical protein